MAVGLHRLKKKTVSGRKDIDYYHRWILFISQVNSKEETPLQAQIPFPSRGRKRNPHLPTYLSLRLDLQEPLCYVGDLQPKCLQVSAEGLETPDHIQ